MQGKASTGKNVYIACYVIAAALLILLIMKDLFYPADTFITDRLYSRLNGTDSRIVLIGIDNETLSEYGNFNLWSREKLAELLDKLYEDEECAPAVVGLDFILTDRFDDDSDIALAEAIRGRDVIVGTNIVYRGAIEFDSEGKRYYNTEHIQDIEMPYDELNEVAVSGFTNTLIASDGYVRYSFNTIDIPKELQYKACESQDGFAYAVYRSYMEKATERMNSRCGMTYLCNMP